MKFTDSTYEELVEQINTLQENVNKLEKKAVSHMQAEYDLETSERNLSAILEMNADGILIVDTDGIVLYVNPAAERLFGRSKDKFLGYSFGFPVSASKTDDTLVIIKKETFCEVEFRVVCVKWDKRQAFQLSVRDITRHKRYEEALRTSEIRFKTLTEFAPVGIFRTDVNGVTNYVNPRYCEISKLNSEEALGKGWLDAVHPEDRSLLDKDWKQAAISGSQSYSEYRFLHTDGSITWVN